MQLRCNYHLGKWAEWHCPHCGKDYCRQCVPAGHDYKLRAGGPKCILCLKKLEYLGSAVGAKTPSQELIANLLFPFHINSLLIFACLTLATIPFLLLLNTALISFSILPLFLIFSAIIEYAGAILLARSDGESKPPEWGKVFKKVDVLYLIKHLAVVGAGIVTTEFCLGINQAFGFFVGCLCLFILPAALIILAIDRSIARAINPLLLLSMIRPFLVSYCGFYFVALALAVFFWSWFTVLLEQNAGLGLSLLWYLGAVASVYVCYAMLGYIMFYYQFDLGNSFVIDRGPTLSKADYDIQRALGDSDILFAEGRYAEARQILKSTMNSTSKNLDVHQRYQNILLQLNDVEALKNHSNFYLAMLFESEQQKTASQAFRAVQKALKDYAPANDEVCLELAEQLQRELDFKGAIELLRSFHEKYLESPLIPKAYLLAADILHTKLNDSHRAAVLLTFVLNNYPNSDFVNRAKQKLKELKAHL